MRNVGGTIRIGAPDEKLVRRACDIHGFAHASVALADIEESLLNRAHRQRWTSKERGNGKSDQAETKQRGDRTTDDQYLPRLAKTCRNC